MTFRSAAALVFAAASLAGGCAAPQRQAATAAQGAPIGAAELRALYAAPHREDGVVLHGAHAGAHWIKWSKPDGSLELSAGHGLFADTGQYVVRGDTVCARWAHIDKGRENCMYLVKIAPDTYTSVEFPRRRGFQLPRPPVGRRGRQQLAALATPTWRGRRRGRRPTSSPARTSPAPPA